MGQRLDVRACFVLCVLLVALPRAAHSQAAPEDHQKAVADFQEARALIKAGHCDRAVPKLEASLTFEASAGTHLSIADCLETVDPFAAWKHLKEAERLAYAKHDERMGPARTRATSLEPKLAVIHIVFAPAALNLPGLELRLDGAIVDRFFFGAGGALAVNPGRHQLTASAPGKAPWSRPFEVTVGTPATANIQLEEAQAATPPPEPATAPAPPPPAVLPSSPPPIAPAGGGSSRRTGALIVGGVGVAGVVLGTVAWGVALSNKKQAENACGGYSTCNSGVGHVAVPGGNSALGYNNDAIHWANVSTGAFITGGALLAGGLLMYLTAPSANPTSAAGGVRVMPEVGIGRAGVGVSGSW